MKLVTRRNITRLLIGSLPFLAVAISWYSLVQFGIVDQTFLPSIAGVVKTLVLVFISESYMTDVWVSIYRISGAFAISAVLAIPLGLLAGYKKNVADLVNPFVGFVRYLPVPAFVPLCILWFGLGDAAKIAVIFLGTFFQLILMVWDVARSVSKEYFDAAQTLGASQSELFFRVLWPASLPGVVAASRTAIGWAWTYLVVAEIAGATSGIGFRIMQSQRYIETPKVFAGIVVIGFLGMLTDFFFQLVQKTAFRWQ